MQSASMRSASSAAMEMAVSFNASVTALPMHLYVLVTQGITMDHAAATALVLVALVLILNAAAFLLSGRKRRR